MQPGSAHLSTQLWKPASSTYGGANVSDDNAVAYQVPMSLWHDIRDWLASAHLPPPTAQSLITGEQSQLVFLTDFAIMPQCKNGKAAAILVLTASGGTMKAPVTFIPEDAGTVPRYFI